VFAANKTSGTRFFDDAAVSGHIEAEMYVGVEKTEARV
jgi:hypothetical protein